MNRYIAQATVLAALLALLCMPAVASAVSSPAPAPAPLLLSAEDEPAESEGIDVVPVAAWTIVGTCIAGLFGGVFYLLKKKLGLFDNPSWVAPISITPSKDFADEGSFGDAPAAGHGHH